MSDINMSRRAAVQIAFAGVDVTDDIRPYLLSLTYTDSEEDEADDLKLQLQDRDGMWLNRWLGPAIDAAAGPALVSAAPEGGTVYIVTAKIGLNVRSGPGTGYGRIGGLAYGATATVLEISGGWARIDYGGKTAYCSAAYLAPASAAQTSGSSGSAGGISIQAVIARQNWLGDGKDDLLDCGQFQLDSVTCSGPPAVVTIAATALPYTHQIRQTLKTQAWEAYKLSGIANEIAARNGMACLFLAYADPWYDRVEQYESTDIGFLSWLCHNIGVSLKTANNMIILFDQRTFEEKAPVRTIRRCDGSYVDYDLSSDTADVQYDSCRVSYTDPATGKVIAGIAYVEDYKADDEDNQQLEITARVASIAEAQTLAEKRLRLHNKYALTATFTMPGDPSMVSGVTVTLEDWGYWDGKYIISQARHSVDRSGYTTQISLRRVLEGY